MHELNVTFVETKNGNFYKLTCTEECYITNWNEGDDILEFNASRQICFAKKELIENYHCISNEDYERLEKLRREAEIKREEEERLRLESEMNK